jgi:signal transduction histidine kinase
MVSTSPADPTLDGVPVCDEGRRPGAVAAIIVVVGVGALAAVSVWGEFTETTPSAPIGLDIAVGVLAVAIAPVLLLRPVPAALALAALAALSPAATPAATLGTLQVARRCPLATAIGVGLAGVAAHVARALWRPIVDVPFGWWFLFVVVAHAALVAWGAWAQARQTLLASLRARARRAETEQARRVAEARTAERTRIAREMHDVLAHRLSLVATYAGALEYRPDASPEQVARAAGVVRDGVHQALQELRDVIEVLRAPGDADADGDALAAADADSGGQQLRPQPALPDIDRLVAESRAAGARIDVSNELPDPDAVPALTSRTGYRVVREGLTNARKHAPGQPVELTVRGRPGQGLSVVIGNPLPTASPASLPSSGTGLIGLTERVELAGGSLVTTRTASGRFLLSARLPWPG